MHIKVPDAIMVPGAPKTGRIFEVLLKVKHTNGEHYRYLIDNPYHKQTINLATAEHMFEWDIEYIKPGYELPKGVRIFHAYWLTTNQPYEEFADSNKDAKGMLKR